MRESSHSPLAVLPLIVQCIQPNAGLYKDGAKVSPKPTEFGTVGGYWENIGWKIRVQFTPLIHRIRPADHMAVLGPHLPAKYSPLQRSGNGNQGVYLAAVPEDMAEVLAGLIGPEAQQLTAGASLITATAPPKGDDLDYWEHKLENAIATDPSIPETEKESIIRSRRGQGLFKQRVLALEKRCRITGVERIEHLVASHCKPWRDSSNTERLNGENGLLLTPSIDHLFDRGFIGFEDTGNPKQHPPQTGRLSQGVLITVPTSPPAAAGR